MGSQIESLLEKLVSVNASMLQRLDVLVEEIKEIKNHFDFTDEKSASHHLIESVRELNSQLDPTIRGSFANQTSQQLDLTTKPGSINEIIKSIKELNRQLDPNVGGSFAHLVTYELDITNKMGAAGQIIKAITG